MFFYFLVACFDQPSLVGVIQCQCSVQHLGQAGCIGKGGQQTVDAILHQFQRALRAGGHDQDPVRPGFQNDVAERFLHRRTGKDVGQLVIRRWIGLPAGPVDALGNPELAGQSLQFLAQRAIAHHQQMQRRILGGCG